MRPSWSMAGRIKPLFVCGSENSRKLPVAVIFCSDVGCVLVLPVAVVVVSVHATSNSARIARKLSESWRYVMDEAPLIASECSTIHKLLRRWLHLQPQSCLLVAVVRP